MGTKSISALLATITMAPAVISATRYNDTVKTNFSYPISNVPGKSHWLRWKCHTRLVAPPHRTITRTRRSSMRTSFRVRSQAR
jgi:hypothetical protein